MTALSRAKAALPRRAELLAPALAAACEASGESPAAVLSSSRAHELVVARWLVFKLAVERLGVSRKKAARLLGRDPGTVLHGLEQLAVLAGQSRHIRSKVEAAEAELSTIEALEAVEPALPEDKKILKNPLAMGIKVL